MKTKNEVTKQKEELSQSDWLWYLVYHEGFRNRNPNCGPCLSYRNRQSAGRCLFKKKELLRVQKRLRFHCLLLFLTFLEGWGLVDVQGLVEIGSKGRVAWWEVLTNLGYAGQESSGKEESFAFCCYANFVSFLSTLAYPAAWVSFLSDPIVRLL